MFRAARPLLTTSSRAIGSRGGRNLGRASSLPLMTSARSIPGKTGSVEIAGSGSFGLATKVLYSTKPPGGGGIDIVHEKDLAKQKLASDPKAVSTESTVRHVFEPNKKPQKEEDDVFKGVKSDLKTVKETFDLSSVPPLSYALGLAGTLPYLATSVSTLYLGWCAKTQWPTSSNILNNVLLSNESATHWLKVLEPIQLGYGAVIISFLGAIHWGLEYAEKAPLRERTRFRYGLGVLAPAVAWPTLLMPIEYALIGQFAAFTGLYFADSRASTRGWAPPWYGTYRFVLTFVTGSAIVITLLGRAKVRNEGGNKKTTEKIWEAKHRGTKDEMPEAQWRKLEAEEKARIQKEKEEKEAAERKKEEEEEKAKKKEKGKGMSTRKGKGDESKPNPVIDEKKQGSATKEEDGKKNSNEDKSDD